jgi:hypothetical protein
MMFILVLLLFPVSGWAFQIDNPGWSFSQRFQGTSNDSGTLLKSDTTAGATVARYMDLYVGLPIYFTRPDVTVAPGGNPEFLNGIGNVYLGLQIPIQNEVANYSSDIVVNAPTGSKERGLNTGRFTFDWNNNVNRTIGPVTPFGNVGFGNTISDTAFFFRPFTSLGLVAHFEGGATLALGPIASVGGSAYALRGAGTQRIISRMVDRPFVRGSGPGLGRFDRVFEVTPEVRLASDFVDDHGVSVWVGLIPPESNVNVKLGYSRSVNYEYDSLFFGIGFKVGSLTR